MKYFWKILATVFTSALMLMLFTGCQPEQIVKVVETVREVPVEVIKEVPKEVPVEVIREVPVEVVKEVPVIKEVPVEVIKEVEVPGEPVIKEVIKEIPVPAEPKKENLHEELVAIFNDGVRNADDIVIRSFKADPLLDVKAKQVGELAAQGIWSPDNIGDAVSAVFSHGNNPNYYIASYFQNAASDTVYESNYYKQIRVKQKILLELQDNKAEIACPDGYMVQNPTAVARVGFAEVQVGTISYTLVLFEVPTVKSGS